MNLFVPSIFYHVKIELDDPSSVVIRLARLRIHHCDHRRGLTKSMKYEGWGSRRQGDITNTFSRGSIEVRLGLWDYGAPRRK